MADSISNTCKLVPTFYCRFHTKETYQLYCKDCNDFVCFQCLGEFHEKHNFCRLQDGEEDIRNQISILFSENENCFTKIEEFNVVIDKNGRQLLNDESVIEHQIKTKADKLTEHIHLHEKCLLAELHNTFKNFQISSQEFKTRVENLRSDVDKFDIDKLPEYKLEEMIHVLSEFKACTVACDKIKNYQKPNFNTDVKCRNEMIDVENSESITISSTMHVSVSTQTEESEDSDTEDEWFDADDDIDEDSIERSSDEIKEDNPFQVYKLNKEIGRIKKICPISENDVWILAARKVYKIADRSLDDTVYVDDVDDIVVLKDGCVLILRNNNGVIMKLLKNKRLVRFANVGNCYPEMISYCFCNLDDEKLAVYLISKSREQRIGFKNRVLQMNKEGVMTAEYNFYTDDGHVPRLMQNAEFNLCVLYITSTYTINYLHVIKLYNDKCEKIKSFDGIFGYNPSSQFECYGICTDNNNVFVSDIRHHSVYVLNKDLKYKKCIVDARNGLDKPSAIAIFNGRLWIVDGNQIMTFDFNITNDVEL